MLGRASLRVSRLVGPPIVVVGALAFASTSGPACSNNDAVTPVDAAIDHALERYHAQAVTIRKSAIDDAPGRNEWVVGTLETRRGKDWDTFHFTCNADFRTRSIRSVNLDPTGPRAR